MVHHRGHGDHRGESQERTGNKLNAEAAEARRGNYRLLTSAFLSKLCVQTPVFTKREYSSPQRSRRPRRRIAGADRKQVERRGRRGTQSKLQTANLCVPLQTLRSNPCASSVLSVTSVVNLRFKAQHRRADALPLARNGDQISDAANYGCSRCH